MNNFSEESIPINLVFSGSRNFNKSLHETLVRLGYSNIKTVKLNDFEEAALKSPKKIFILPVTNDSTVQKRIKVACNKLKEKPVLGIIRTTVRDLNDILVKTCNDIIYWPFSDNEFAYRMKKISEVCRQNENLTGDVGLLDDFLCMNMIGQSPPFLHVLRNIKKFSGCDAPVLIEGETGTGKELTARAIHYLGERRDYPFIPVNCGAIPDSLLENELFGHQQGAFTDASTSQEGLVCQAENGTLFLDEVETFSEKGQVVLLRFLQDLQYKSLGSNKHKKANVRIVAASNVKLQEMVKMGKFRKDLFYRLNIMPILMPTLSQRGNDVLELANYFLNKFKKQYNQSEKRLDKNSIEWLMQYSWPGNVRELENLLHREFLLAEGPDIRLGQNHVDNQEWFLGSFNGCQESSRKKNMQEEKAEAVRRFEIEYLTRLLNETGGNVTKAARKAGKERRSFGKLIKKHGIDITNLNI